MLQVSLSKATKKKKDVASAVHGPKPHKNTYAFGYMIFSIKDDVNCDAWTDELQKYLKGYR